MPNFMTKFMTKFLDALAFLGCVLAFGLALASAFTLVCAFTLMSAFTLVCALTMTAPLRAQGLDLSKLLQPPTGTWPMYNGDYSGRRFSTLAQINQSNVKSLTLAWAFQTHAQAGISATPLEVNGILYFTLPNDVFAVDARTGRQIWHINRPAPGGLPGAGHRGVAMYKDYLYYATPDAKLLCLDARNGKTVWEIQMADPALKAFGSAVPLVVGDHLILGISGDIADLPGYVESLDPMTGKLQWKWDAMPKPDDPAWATWPHDTDVVTRGGGMTWLTGTYDPELNLVYWGTGNPHPVEAGDARPGANLYTCSIVALNADTGKLAWYFQISPHDTHDWDAIQTPILFDGTFNGKPRKMLAQASRNGVFAVLDRSNGQSLLTTPYIDINWMNGTDERGQPVPKKETEPKLDGALAKPGAAGGSNWSPPSFDPQTGLFYASAKESIGIYYVTMPGKIAEGWGGRDFILNSKSMLEAIDYHTGKVKWSLDTSGARYGWPGILTTAGHLLFTLDDSGRLLALDPATGKGLWHTYTGGSSTSAPITYELDGRQYILTPADSVIYSWALPETTPDKTTDQTKGR
jgi:acido-empty-quinoprotein group A